MTLKTQIVFYIVCGVPCAVCDFSVKFLGFWFVQGRDSPAANTLVGDLREIIVIEISIFERVYWQI